MNKLKYLILVILLMSIQNSYSQIKLKEKRIYLVDLTASMEGKGNVKTPNIFQNVKESLIATMNSIEGIETEVTIIPFTNKVHDVRSFTLQGKDSLVDYLDKLTILRGDTNLVDAWKAGVAQIDSTKVNYLFMLTDGLHNTGPDKKELLDGISNWKEFSKDKYYYSFYVMLTDHAEEVGISNAILSSNQIWMIKSMDINVTIFNTSNFYRMNVTNNNIITLNFERNHNKHKNVFGLDVLLEGEAAKYYQIKGINNVLETEKMIHITVEEKVDRSEIPLSVSGYLDIKYNKSYTPLLFFTPERISLQIDNSGIRTMYFKAQ